MRKGKSTHADVAVRYAEQVVSGEIPACWQIRASARRFLDDIASAAWVYDANLVHWACSFLELMPMLDGEAAALGQHLRLQPFQTWITAALFGLVDQHGLRKHREALVMNTRKQGKSTFAGGLANLMVAADGEPRAQVYVGAKNLAQADFVFGTSMKIEPLPVPWTPR